MKIIQSEIAGQVVGGVIAVLAVTAASYIWRIPQERGPQVLLIVYAASVILLVSGAFVIFRRIVPRSYAQNQHLTPFPFFLQLLIWGLFFAFPCIYNPYNWAWSQSHASQVIPVLARIGWAGIWIGLGILVIALGWLGLSRSCGQGTKRLEISGPYRLARNPQLMGGATIVIGYVFLWPSWYTAGWVVLYAMIAHLMVLTEEGFLLAVHGEAYIQYCKRVPRYLGIPG